MDVVERLRVIAQGMGRLGSIEREAADEIERLKKEVEWHEEEKHRLRKELWNIIDDCESDYPPSHGAIKYAALRALGEGKE